MRQQQWEVQSQVHEGISETYPRLYAYLNELEKPLASLGEEQAKDWRQEAEQHLLYLIAAHEELGSTHDQAVTIALQQFGDTKKIGQSIVRELRRQQKQKIEYDVVRFYEPLALGFAAQFLMLLLIIAVRYYSYNMHSLLAVENILVFISVLISVASPISAGWRYRVTRQLPNGFLGVDPRHPGNRLMQAVSWAMFVLLLVGIGSFNGGYIASHNRLCLLVGLFYPLLALLGGQLAGLRIRGVLQKLGTNAPS